MKTSLLILGVIITLNGCTKVALSKANRVEAISGTTHIVTQADIGNFKKGRELNAKRF